jgi:hypothetical protein
VTTPSASPSTRDALGLPRRSRFTESRPGGALSRQSPRELRRSGGLFDPIGGWRSL